MKSADASSIGPDLAAKRISSSSSLRPALRRLVARFVISAGSRKSIYRNPLGAALLRSFDRLIFESFLVSYPKCGRTWLHLLIQAALQLHYGAAEPRVLDSREIMTLDARAPKFKVVKDHDGYPHLNPPSRIRAGNYRGKKVVFLVRDPRDAIVSLYFWRTRRQGSYQGGISDFIREPAGGIASLVCFYNAWAEGGRNTAGFLRVRYEDLHECPAAELRKVLAFLGVPEVRDEVLREAAGWASFDNMRRWEISGRFGKVRRPEDPESLKAREGKVRNYPAYLSEADIAFLNETIDRDLSNEYVSYKNR